MLAQANVILFHAKKNELVRSFIVSPRLTQSGTDLIITTQVRVEGELSFRPLNWSVQSIDQARTDLFTASGSKDTPEWKAFCADLEKLKTPATPVPAQTRKQPPRRPAPKK